MIRVCESVSIKKLYLFLSLKRSRTVEFTITHRRYSSHVVSITTTNLHLERILLKKQWFVRINHIENSIIKVCVRIDVYVKVTSIFIRRKIGRLSSFFCLYVFYRAGTKRQTSLDKDRSKTLSFIRLGFASTIRKTICRVNLCVK